MGVIQTVSGVNPICANALSIALRSVYRTHLRSMSAASQEPDSILVMAALTPARVSEA